MFLHLLTSSLLILRCASIPATQLSALRDLYYNTSGDSWAWRPVASFGPQWDFSSPGVDPCADGTDSLQVWQGLACDYGPTQCITNASLCSITEIALSSYSLDGRIPSTLDQLIGMQNLILQSNQIFGSIPHSFGSLTNLLYLDL